MKTNIFQLQLGRQMIIPEPGRESGMVYCPVKMAHIAVMKCGTNQKLEKCRCGNGASKERIAALKALLREFEREEDRYLWS